MQMPRSRALIALILASALVVGGCSSPDAPPLEGTAAADYVPTPFIAPATPTPPAAGPGTAEPVASTAALPLARLPVAEFVRASGEPARLPIEVIPTGEFGVGLSGRRTLGERGMLFAYDTPGQEGPFWMKNTHIDLDIAFIDASGRIVSIRTMRAESEEYVYSSAPYQSALEAPAGWYAAHGVGEGDRVRYLPPTVPTTP
jgi:uncharacterized membrane protein (UPF0127 family)